MDSWFFDGKTPNSSRNGIDQFFGPYPPHRHTIIRAKIRGNTAFFIHIPYSNVVIRVFRHVEFIYALITELNPTVFEKYAEIKSRLSRVSLFLHVECDFCI